MLRKHSQKLLWRHRRRRLGTLGKTEGTAVYSYPEMVFTLYPEMVFTLLRSREVVQVCALLQHV